ncbi:MAG: AI-2E family transporter [Spirochaetes bacterium]|nr:AI-2E family transporter [Spirochaetota bacterium]
MVKKDSYFTLKKNKNLKRLFFLFFGAVGVGLLLIFRYYFWPFLMAIILYLALRPLFERILSRVKNRTISSMIVIILLIVLFLVPVVYLLISLTNQALQIYRYIVQNIDESFFGRMSDLPFFTLLSQYLHVDEAAIFTRISEFAQQTAGRIVAGITSFISYPLNLLINFFFLLLILFFLFKDGYRISPLVYRILPFPDDLEKQVVERLKQVIKILLLGNLIIMILQGVMVGAGFYLVGFRAALLWGSMAAIMSLIPVVGTTFIWVPGVVFLVLQGSYLGALFLGGWCLGWYLFLENVVKPKVFGEKLHFHPVVLFFLLLGSLHALNLPGIIIGPLLLTLFYSLWEIYKILEGIEPKSPADPG